MDGVPAGQIGEKLRFRRESRSLIYTAEYPVMNDLLAYLTENCCQGDASACGVVPCEPATDTNEEPHEAPARANVRR